MKLVKWIVFCVAACSLLAGCKKKAVGVFIPEWAGTVEAEETDVFAHAVVAPESDFQYRLSRDNNGVVIDKFIGSSWGREIIIPSEIEGLPVVELSGNCFYNTDAKTVVMPDSITEIGYSLFEKADKLEHVKLSNSITVIPKEAFKGCTILTHIEIPSSVTIIGDYAFRESGLRSIVVPETVSFSKYKYYGTETQSGYGAFAGCRNLEYVKLPSSMKEMPAYMFACCSALESIELPENLEVLGEAALGGCTRLEQISLPETLTTINNSFACSGIKSLVIPESVTSLYLHYCQNLKRVRLPESLTEISERLFLNADGNYKRFDIHILVSLNGELGFSRETSLESVNLPASLKKIEGTAFSGMDTLEELIIPDSLTSIEFVEGYDSFSEKETFRGTHFSLALQRRLRQLGYEGNF